MKNVVFKQMDSLIYLILEFNLMLLNVAGSSIIWKNQLGLAKLVQQLKPGGYIKLGLYSEIARKLIVDRNIIQALGETSTPERFVNLGGALWMEKLMSFQIYPDSGISLTLRMPRPLLPRSRASLFNKDAKLF